MKTKVARGTIFILMAFTFLLAATSGYAAEQSAEEAAGAGQLLRKEESPPAVICGGCVSATHTSEGKGSITPYGRIELDAIYSNRNTNPLDPGQFNGYATAAGKGSNATSTLNPRLIFSAYAGIGPTARIADRRRQSGFTGQTDNAGNISPRLRLANVKYSPNSNKTVSPPVWTGRRLWDCIRDLIDFSIMGYNGNLWQRLPQVTVKHQFSENFDGLITASRFERGLSAIGPQQQGRPQAAGAVPSVPFQDPVQMPYFGTRFGYTGTGNMQGFVAAFNMAYRYYRSAPPFSPTVTQTPGGRDINSYVIGGELGRPDYQATEVLRRTGLWPGTRRGMVPVRTGPESANRCTGSDLGGMGRIGLRLQPGLHLHCRVWIRQPPQFKSPVYRWRSNCRHAISHEPPHLSDRRSSHLGRSVCVVRMESLEYRMDDARALQR